MCFIPGLQDRTKYYLDIFSDISPDITTFNLFKDLYPIYYSTLSESLELFCKTEKYLDAFPKMNEFKT